MTTDPEATHRLLEQLEEKVEAVLQLPEKARALGFQKLRDAHPEHGALLERCERAAELLDPELCSAESVTAAVRTASLAEAPKQIDHYKILDLLGEGGMGIVYLAEQQEPVRRRVALKVIKVGVDSKDVIARFEAERQALALMSHANIAKVLDAGATRDGRPYFALEHIPGLPITDYCDRQRIDLRGRIELFQKVCRGVQHAHQKGIIHRDIKPSNILVQQRDGFAEPRIIDFGVAKAVQQRLTERTLYTEQGRIIGTFEYMSPEQAEMSTLDIDTRSDIYSLGVLLYQLLAGQLPFDPMELRAAGLFEMQRRIREEEPERPSTRCTRARPDSSEIALRRCLEPSELSRALHGELDWIVLRCLEKDPARRYQSASEVAADLQRYLDHEPVVAGPPSATYRLKKLLRKHRTVAAAVLAVFLALVGGLSIAVWQYREAEASAHTARTNEQRALAAEREATASGERFQALSIAAAADTALDEDPITALLLALQAYDLDRSPETIGQVQTVLAEQYVVAELLGHTDQITSADLGAESRRVVTASSDGTIRLWNDHGDELASWPQGDHVYSVEFTPDEQQILSVVARGGDRSVHIGARPRVARILALDGTLVEEIGGDGDRALDRADWDPDTSRLLVRFVDGGAIAILDRSGERVHDLVDASQTGPGPVPLLYFSPAGHAVLASPAQTRIWRSGEPQPIELQAQPGGTFIMNPGALAIARRDDLIATAQWPHVVGLWNTRGERVTTLVGHTFFVGSVQFSPSGAAILTASGDGTARLWDRNGNQTAVATAGAQVLHASFFGSDHRFLTVGTAGVGLWSDLGQSLARLPKVDSWTNFHDLASLADVEAGEAVYVQGRRAELLRLSGVENLHLRSDGDRPWGQPALHPDGPVLTGSNRGRVFAWDRDGKLLRQFDSATALPVYGVDVSEDGSRILAGGSWGRLAVWDWETAETVWTWDRPPRNSRLSFALGAEMTSSYFLSSGQILTHSSSSQGNAFLVDPETDRHELFIPREEVYEWWLLAADRSMVAGSAYRTGVVTLLDRDGRGRTDFRPHMRYTTHVAFHPDGERMATASHDGTIKLWDRNEVLKDPAAVEPLRTIPWEATPSLVEFSPDGTRMLITTASRAYVTDLEGRVEFHFWPREGKEDYFHPAARFSADGKWILGTAYDGLRRWPAHEEDLIRMARSWADRLRGDRDLSKYSHLWKD